MLNMMQPASMGEPAAVLHQLLLSGNSSRSHPTSISAKVTQQLLLPQGQQLGAVAC